MEVREEAEAAAPDTGMTTVDEISEALYGGWGPYYYGGYSITVGPVRQLRC